MRSLRHRTCLTLLTFTIPEELRAWFRSHPQRDYRLFFREVVATLLEIGANPERFGARLGFLAVHTVRADRTGNLVERDSVERKG